jgi:hypothetical protein
VSHGGDSIPCRGARVTTPGEPSAASITVCQTLALLDDQHRGLADGVANGRYAFWLGSGISRNRVPGLDTLVEKVLEFLRAGIDPGDPGCRFRAALDDALALADPSAQEQAQIDYTHPVVSWSPREALLQRLVNRYSQLLNVEVEGEPSDYLLWDAVDVRASYPADAEPDCGHLCLAILCLEGLVPDAACANWDGLIESAIRELHGDPAYVLKVVVLPGDARLPDRRTRLLKFHGCAVLAAHDEAKYRGALVGSEHQITHWSTGHEHQTMRDSLQALAVAKPTFVIGLSAQDHNIQIVFAAAEEQLPWTWPSDPPPPAVFAADELGEKHGALLKTIYRDTFAPHAADIKRGALLRAYAEQTLCALVLYTFAAKLNEFLANAQTSLSATQLAELGGGFITLRDLLSHAAEPDRLKFTRSFAEREGRAMSLFRSGEEPPTAGSYGPLSTGPLDDIAHDIHLVTSGMPELAGGLALIGSGVTQHHWQVSLDTTSTGFEGALTLTTVGQPATAVYFSANPRASTQLGLEGVSTAAGDVVIIHSTGIPEGPTRSPGGRPGRRGTGGRRDVDMADLLTTSRDLDDLYTRFREAAVL